MKRSHQFALATYNLPLNLKCLSVQHMFLECLIYIIKCGIEDLRHDQMIHDPTSQVEEQITFHHAWKRYTYSQWVSSVVRVGYAAKLKTVAYTKLIAPFSCKLHDDL